jgi:hypothetical protein
MSAWRQAVKVLYAKPDHTGTLRDCDLAGIVGAGNSSGLKYAGYLGLAEFHGHRGRGHWKLTPRGIDWCEGRVVLALGLPHRPGVRAPYRLRATWLSSLPRDIRINQGAEA